MEDIEALSQKQMVKQLWDAVVGSRLMERFIVLESEHLKRGQNCPMLLEIQNGKIAGARGKEAADEEIAYRAITLKRAEKTEDIVSNIRVQVAGIVAAAMILQTLVLAIVMWLMQRGL